MKAETVAKGFGLAVVLAVVGWLWYGESTRRTEASRRYDADAKARRDKLQLEIEEDHELRGRNPATRHLRNAIRDLGWVVRRVAPAPEPVRLA